MNDTTFSPMRVISLTAENYARLSAVDITPRGNLVQITGANGNGKTSVIDALFVALAGLSIAPEEPIHHGAKSARIRVALGQNGTVELVVRRTFSPSGSTLTVESSSGKPFRSPQALLDSLLGTLAYDPLEFTRMKPREQYDALRQFVKLDVDLDELDRQNAEDFAERTDVNRRAKQARSTADAIDIPDDLPAELIDTAALLDQIQRAGETNAERSAARRRRQEYEAETEKMVVAQAGQLAEIDRLRNYLKALEDATNERATTIEERTRTATGMRPVPDDVDIAAVRAQLDGAQSTNRHIEARQRRDGFLSDAETYEFTAETLTHGMEAREHQKRDAIAKADMPLPGLSFGNSIVLYNSVPFSQASSAEQLLVSARIAMSMNPTIRIARIKDGSLLDSQSLELLATLARDNDFQLWVEKVDESGKIGFTIEDGKLAAVNGEPPRQRKEAK